MATVITSNRFGFTAVYDDRLLPLLEALGHVTVRRATSVEWDEVESEWVATHLETGTIISRGKNRSNVIEEEVKWLESRM